MNKTYIFEATYWLWEPFEVTVTGIDEYGKAEATAEAIAVEEYEGRLHEDVDEEHVEVTLSTVEVEV